MEVDISTLTGTERDERHADERVARRPAKRRSGRTALAVVLGLLVGLAVAFLVPRLLDDGDDVAGEAATISEARRSLDEADGSVNAPADLLEDGPVPPGAGAGSAEAAVTGFLDAEAASDFETSFGFLSAQDRQFYGSPAGWEASHADVFPPVVSYEVEEAGPDAFVTTVVFEPGLDPVTGLIPGQARITWDVTTGPEGDMGVALETSLVEPLYPAEEDAVDAARRWADARQACETPSNERSLIGTPVLAQQLCDADGSFTLGEPRGLEDFEATPFFTALGAEAVSASRVVRISGPAEFGAVLAPIGDQWSVIGVVP
jgi:hypothetical protein